ncbi:hypothetical protein TSUD_353110 [Trifolium subterraneum]|nr:hypothetical protein TSUD_353110 [Trifolium subterraneum]
MDKISPVPQTEIVRKQATKKRNVLSTKRKLPHAKKAKLFKEFVRKQAAKKGNVPSIKRELPHGKKPKPFKEVAKKQTVESTKGELPRAKNRVSFEEFVRKTVAKAGFRDRVEEPNMELILNGQVFLEISTNFMGL